MQQAVSSAKRKSVLVTVAFTAAAVYKLIKLRTRVGCYCLTAALKHAPSRAELVLLVAEHIDPESEI